MASVLAGGRSDGFDLFICHASEDKERVVRPLAKALLSRGLRVWLDELELTIGDSLHGRIDAGLARSRFGVVVISPAFFAKEWPQKELAGLAAREGPGVKVILPVWHEVDREFIAQHSPILADRLGATTSAGIDDVAEKIALVLRRADGAPTTVGAQRAARSMPRALSHAPSASRTDRSNRHRLTVAGATLALATGVGYAVAPTPSTVARPDGLPNSVANLRMEASFPPGWLRSATVPSTPVTKLGDPLALRAGGSNGALVIGTATSTSPTLLPATLLSALPHFPRSDAVGLGGKTFYRYRDIRPIGEIGLETVYALPTSSGIVLGICLLPERQAGLTERDCELILGSLKLTRARPIQPGPQSSYATTLGGTVSQLNESRMRLGRELARASTDTSQSHASAQLARAHDDAARSLRTATPGPGERAASTSIVAALEQTARGYEQMAASADVRDSGSYDRGRTNVNNATVELRRALSSLSRYGYNVGN